MRACPATPHQVGWNGSIGQCRRGLDLVILELGANDALRGISPDITRDNLDKMLTRLKDRKIHGGARRHACPAVDGQGL
jgi:lysophospholipase L1-like esterase